MRDKRNEEGFMPTSQVLDRYGINKSTLQRWLRDNRLEFPQPLVLGYRSRLFKLSELEAWERRRAALSRRERD